MCGSSARTRTIGTATTWSGRGPIRVARASTCASIACRRAPERRSGALRHAIDAQVDARATRIGPRPLQVVAVPIVRVLAEEPHIGLRDLHLVGVHSTPYGVNDAASSTISGRVRSITRN